MALAFLQDTVLIPKLKNHEFQLAQNKFLHSQGGIAFHKLLGIHYNSARNSIIMLAIISD